MSKSAPDREVDRLLSTLRETFVGVVRRDGHDLSARCHAMFLICYLADGPHTVRGLAGRLNISKPAVTRSLDALEVYRLIKRHPDPSDGRSVVLSRTKEGLAYLNELRAYMAEGYRSWAPNPKRQAAAGAATEATAGLHA